MERGAKKGYGTKGKQQWDHRHASSKEEAETPEESEEVQALKVELEKAQVVKERFKTTTIKVQKECDKLRDVNLATAEALERETKRARKEEWGRKKF